MKCAICKKKHLPKMFCHTCGKVLVHEGCICNRKPKFVPLPSLIGMLGVKNGKVLPARLFNHLDRWLGLEIEISTLGSALEYRDAPVRYQWTHDGSITPGGREMVVEPLKGDDFLRGMVGLVKMFEVCGCAVDHSCGLHVHVGAMDFGPYELRRLITLYSAFEKQVFKGLVDPSRLGSRYCKTYNFGSAWMNNLWTIKHPGELRRFFLQWLYPNLRKRESHKTQGFIDVPATKKYKYHECRYYGVNLHSWMERGTIEWRQSQGSLELDRLVYWPLFCGWFTHLAGALTDKEVYTLKNIKDLITGSWKRQSMTLEFPKALREWALEVGGME